MKFQKINIIAIVLISVLGIGCFSIVSADTESFKRGVIDKTFGTGAE